MDLDITETPQGQEILRILNDDRRPWLLRQRHKLVGVAVSDMELISLPQYGQPPRSFESCARLFLALEMRRVRLNQILLPAQALQELSSDALSAAVALRSNRPGDMNLGGIVGCAGLAGLVFLFARFLIWIRMAYVPAVIVALALGMLVLVIFLEVVGSRLKTRHLRIAAKIWQQAALSDQRSYEDFLAHILQHGVYAAACRPHHRLQDPFSAYAFREFASLPETSRIGIARFIKSQIDQQPEAGDIRAVTLYRKIMHRIPS